MISPLPTRMGWSMNVKSTTDFWPGSAGDTRGCRNDLSTLTKRPVPSSVFNNHSLIEAYGSGYPRVCFDWGD